MFAKIKIRDMPRVAPPTQKDFSFSRREVLKTILRGTVVIVGAPLVGGALGACSQNPASVVIGNNDYRLLETEHFSAGEIKKFDGKKVQVEFEGVVPFTGSPASLRPIFNILKENGSYFDKLPLLKGEQAEFKDPNTSPNTNQYYMIQCTDYSGEGADSSATIAFYKSK